MLYGYLVIFVQVLEVGNVGLYLVYYGLDDDCWVVCWVMIDDCLLLVIIFVW